MKKKFRINFVVIIRIVSYNRINWFVFDWYNIIMNWFHAKKKKKKVKIIDEIEKKAIYIIINIDTGVYSVGMYILEKFYLNDLAV